MTVENAGATMKVSDPNAKNLFAGGRCLGSRSLAPRGAEEGFLGL